MSRTEATIGNTLRYPIRVTEQLPSTFMATMMMATTPQAMQDLLAPKMNTGSIREYSQVGDGVHLRQLPLLLLPLTAERAPPRPQMVVRKVSVVGSHVLRYLSRSNNISPRRPQLHNYLHANAPLIDQNISHRSTSYYDLPDDYIPWVGGYAEPQLESESGSLRTQPESYRMRQMLPSSLPSDDSSFLGKLNWKVYLGMLCIIAMQALLKLAFQQIYLSWDLTC